MIGVHPSTVSRELKRGKGKTTQNYWPVTSHERDLKL